MGDNSQYKKQRKNAFLLLLLALAKENIIMLPTHVNKDKWVEL